MRIPLKTLFPSCLKKKAIIGQKIYCHLIPCRPGRINLMRGWKREIGGSLEKIMRFIFEAGRPLIHFVNGGNYKGSALS